MHKVPTLLLNINQRRRQEDKINVKYEPLNETYIFLVTFFGKSIAKEHANYGQVQTGRYFRKDRVTRKHYYKILQI